MNLDFSNKKDTSLNGTDDWSPLELYGDKSIGLYVENVDAREKDTSPTTKASTGTNKSITKNTVIYGNFAVDIGNEINSKSKNYTYKSNNKIDMSNLSGSNIDEFSTEEAIGVVLKENVDGMP